MEKNWWYSFLLGLWRLGGVLGILSHVACSMATARGITSCARQSRHRPVVMTWLQNPFTARIAGRDAVRLRPNVNLNFVIM